MRMWCLLVLVVISCALSARPALADMNDPKPVGSPNVCSKGEGVRHVQDS
jgi:hypothetical protein